MITYQSIRTTDINGETVICANKQSAIAYATGRIPNKVDTQPITTVSCVAYVSPTGQYYVQHGNQRMDVANAATARYYAANGVSIGSLLTASLEGLRA